MNPWFWPAVGYLLGSISFSILVVRLVRREDVRTLGSGNAGATNVLRTTGKGAALAVMLGDVGKGVVTVLLARAFGAPSSIVALSAVAAIVGHMFPIFFSFRGGKGVATAAGTFLVIAPLPTLAIFPVWIGVVAVTRLVSLGSILTAFALPTSCWLFSGPVTALGLPNLTDRPTVLAAAVTGFLVIVKHHTNVRRLLTGEEARLGQREEAR